MSIRFAKSGILNTIQDLGRFGHRREGINPGGAMDRASLRVLNILLGNDENEAAIEIHFPSGEIIFESACLFSVTGGNFDASLSNFPVDAWKTYPAAAGQVLRFNKRLTGQRVYLGVAGGFDIPEWFGSKSTNLSAHAGGFEGRPLSMNDRVGFKRREAAPGSAGLCAGSSLKNNSRASMPIRFTAGPEFSLLSPLAVEKLLTEKYRISSDSNRMGYRLNGEPLFLLDNVEMISTAVDFGTIQLLPSGQLVVLMADHQTTGGYPRIGQVIARDLPRLAQSGAGDDFKFEISSIDAAERLDLEFEKDLAFLRVGRRLKVGE